MIDDLLPTVNAIPKDDPSYVKFLDDTFMKMSWVYRCSQDPPWELQERVQEFGLALLELVEMKPLNDPLLKTGNVRIFSAGRDGYVYEAQGDLYHRRHTMPHRSRELEPMDLHTRLGKILEAHGLESLYLASTPSRKTPNKAMLTYAMIKLQQAFNEEQSSARAYSLTDLLQSGGVLIVELKVRKPSNKQ